MEAPLIRRYFTTEGVHPYDEVEWERRDSRITNYQDGSVAFEQLGVEFPTTWSINATNIVTQKYFRGTPGTPERESSLKQVINRVVETISDAGLEAGHLDTQSMDIFEDELTYLLLHQMVAFNSPVWFNIGVKDVPQQASACFILSVDDTMQSILNWYTEEGMIFKGGSGAGVNLSKIRSSKETLNGGGNASGPVSFMRGADASAGSIKSGGKTRRAAKMVILDVDHPDVEEFIWTKAREERKIRALAEAGFDMSLDGADMVSVQYQNANNSVRVTDEFMQAVVDDRDWHLRAKDGSIVKTIRARDLLRQFAQASWECADPGMQFDTTINAWHTLSNTDRINASNPCSEYMSIDNSACNLASLNLLKFLNEEDHFDVEAFKAAIEVTFVAQDILVGYSDYPTEAIGENARKYRQLGLGYANLGALLMALGLPYDSDEGRAWAAAITALMTGHAYATSAKMAEKVGCFDGYRVNEAPMRKVIGMHADAADHQIDNHLAPAYIRLAAREAWGNAYENSYTYGLRNSQATVLAPTGTIALMMDCDTTGVEPDLSLYKMKTLVGGGTMTIINQGVPRSLKNMGYSDDQIKRIVKHLEEHKTIYSAPDLEEADHRVFDCAMGENAIDYMGHVRMMGAVQPFISGAISKTVNLPEEATVEEIEQLHIEAWYLGVKAIAIYRDGCKNSQPLSTIKKDEPAVVVEKIVEKIVQVPVRERLPRTRASKTFEFRVADCKGFITVGEYSDGRPGEIFVRVSKQGSTLAGIMDAFAISLSYGLQYGVPLREFVKAIIGQRFDPAGMTDDPDIRIATSLMDYLFRKLAVEYLTYEERLELGVLTVGERTQPELPGLEDAEELVQSAPQASKVIKSDAPLCMQCGVQMQRAGSCHACPSCGNTSGCS